jgi:hypothetical protein
MSSVVAAAGPASDCFFVGRAELLTWVNALLGCNLSKVEAVRAGGTDTGLRLHSRKDGDVRVCVARCIAWPRGCAQCLPRADNTTTHACYSSPLAQRTARSSTRSTREQSRCTRRVAERLTKAPAGVGTHRTAPPLPLHIWLNR